ncbi:MAG: capsid protein [Clostridium sp.]|uniref:phage minor capsid protein n=1 Tax=Clostridium sp. TaxID=1506 RepID=UPI00115B9B95|nr:phage minor capsid protein [Clostridium sp.]MBS4958276.1 capsid protein [Clostridium sp.]MDU2155354.1 phage minor capsid protein [Clostridium sp.]
MAKKNNHSKLGEILKNVTKKSIQDNAAKEREKSYDIRKIFEQMELDLISSMRRAFYFHQNEQEKEGFEWEQWQLSKLRAMEQYRARNKKIVGKYNKPIQDAINKELKGNFSKGENVVARFIDKVKQVLRWRNKEYQSIEFPDDIDTSTLKGHIAKELGSPGAIPQEKNFFGVNEKKLEALIKTVNNDLNKAQYSVLRKIDDVYRQTIFKSHMYLQNGAKTLNQAIDMATKDFLDKGINSIEYKNGARVNIASYAEMCLRTASHRATLLGEGKKRDEYGIHLIVVSAHGNTCRMCEPWQGMILIDDIFSHPSKEYVQEHKVKYKLLSEAIEKGLLHPNCRHTLTTYFPGITRLPVAPDGKKAIKVYEAEQKQRALERQIRKWKRIEAGSVDEENKIKAANNVRTLQNKLKQHIKENNELRINSNRIEVKEFNPIDHKEYLKKYDERVKIKRDGASRAEEFSKHWEEASLGETINKFTPDYEVIEKLNKGKILYKSDISNIQIVYDANGNYFRIEDLTLKGKRRYLDINGNNVSNKIENGKQKGRSKEEYEALTHFKNKDGEN